MPDPETGVLLAAWWKRLVAAAVDVCLLGAFSYTVELIWFFSAARSMFRLQAGVEPHFPSAFFAGLGAVGGSTLVVMLLYYGFLVGSKKGQTVGMMVMGLAVRDAADGGPIGFWRAFARQLVAIGLMIVFEVPFIIDCLAPLWDRRRQAWHDHAVSCLVVDIRP